MRRLKFYGASDDLFEIEGGRKGEPDEIDPKDAVTIVASTGGVIVSVHYSPGNNGCWAVGVSQLGEDAPLPPWPMHFETGPPSRGYSVVLVVDAPDDAAMLVVGGRRHD